MKFRTEIQLQPSERKISHSQQIFGIGSCFVSEIGQKLSDLKFRTLINPYGTLFHPLAIENALMRIFSLTEYSREEIFKYGELFFSWDHHTSFDRPTENETLKIINTELETANNFVRNANCFLLTFGTSWIYRLNDSGLFVANCHKVPQHVFEKSLLTEKQLCASIKNCFDLIFDVCPNAHIIATVSPVRHTRDGIIENSLSKARLISSLHEVLAKYETVDYFPTYELLNDDLRDYRFYSEDLVHPNQMAVDYIWQKFSEVYFDENTNSRIEQLNKINSALAHRPLNPKTVAYKEFLYKTGKMIEAAESQFPKNCFAEEKIKLQKLNELC